MHLVVTIYNSSTNVNLFECLLVVGEMCPCNFHPSGWLRASAFTCRLIFLVGVKKVCLRINKQAFPSLHSQASKAVQFMGRGFGSVHESFHRHAGDALFLLVWLPLALSLSLALFLELSRAITHTLSLSIYLSLSLALAPSFSISLYLSLVLFPLLSFNPPEIP